MLYRMEALRLAQRDLGVTEWPPGSNWGPRVSLYLRSAGLNFPAPWCMAFVHYQFQKAGLELEHPNKASVGYFETWARRNGYLVHDPEPGDVVCYRFDSDSWPDHVGIVKAVDRGHIVVVEGNTSLGNDSNGGKVMLRQRQLGRCSFVRVPGGKPDEVTRWPRRLPSWFWPWAEWRLGEGPFKRFGPAARGRRPKGAPAVIPPWAWLRLRALKKARRK